MNSAYANQTISYKNQRIWEISDKEWVFNLLRSVLTVDFLLFAR